MKKKNLFSVCVLSSATALLFSSCASIITGTKADITIDGSVFEPVTITTNYRTYEDVELPMVVKVKKKKLSGQRIKIESENYTYKDIVLRKEVNPWILGNILIGGLFGLGVDMITNAVSQPVDDNFYIKGKKKEAVPASQPAPLQP